MTIRICVSFIPKNVDEALKLVKKAEKYKPDFIEVRLDQITERERLAEIPSSTDTPLIATNRSVECGGGFRGSEGERINVLRKAAYAGFNYVDIEVSTPNLKDFISELRSKEAKAIVSFHDFAGTPNCDELNKILEFQLESGAEICKIVTTAKKLEDNLTLMSFLNQVSKKAKIVCFAMGDLGKISRLLSPLFGGFFTIASLEKGGETAPGQLTIQELKTAYQALGVYE